MGEPPRQDRLDFADAAHEPTAAQPVQPGLFPDDSIARRKLRRLPARSRAPARLRASPPATGLLARVAGGAVDSWNGRFRQPTANASFKTSWFSVVKRLLDTGISLHKHRVAVDHLRQRGVQGPGEHHAVLRWHHGVRMHFGRRVVDLLRGGRGYSVSPSAARCARATGSIADFPGRHAPTMAVPFRPPRQVATRRREPRPPSADPPAEQTHRFLFLLGVSGTSASAQRFGRPEFRSRKRIAPARESSRQPVMGAEGATPLPSTSSGTRTAHGNDASGKWRLTWYFGRRPLHGERRRHRRHRISRHPARVDDRRRTPLTACRP